MIRSHVFLEKKSLTLFMKPEAERQGERNIYPMKIVKAMISSGIVHRASKEIVRNEEWKI